MSDEKSYEIESVVGDGVKVTFHLKSEMALSTPEGRLRLAAAMADPIRRNLSMSLMARRAFAVDPLPFWCARCGSGFVSEDEKSAHGVDECLVSEIMHR